MHSFIIYLFIIAIYGDNSCNTNSRDSYNSIVQELKEYVESNQQFALELNMTFLQAGHGPNSANPVTFDDIYNFFDSILTLAPSKDNAMIVPLTIWQFAKTDMGEKLVTDPIINNWFKKWLNQWKQYLDSSDSTIHLSTWLDTMDMSDFIVPDDGYHSFNQFFKREIKTEKRPIHSKDDPTIITSPVDGVLDFVLHNITVNDEQNKFLVKGIEFNLFEIFGGNESKVSKYENGTLLLMSLYFNNYHHYHSYCNNVLINDIDELGGYYFLFNDNSKIINNCSLNDIPACHAFWHHINRRGIIHMKCNYNKYENNIQSQYDTAMIVVGLGHVSSVNFVVQPQSENILKKGDKIGYFAYGGSTLSIVFPQGVIDQVLVDIGQETQMGKPLASLRTL